MDITDNREITFHTDALLRAIRAHPTTRPDTLPQDLEFLPSSNSIKVVYGSGAAAYNETLRAEQIAAILISHCMRIRVPVPRHAGKAVQVCDAHVRMIFATSIDPVPLDPRSATRAPTNQSFRSWFPEEQFS